MRATRRGCGGRGKRCAKCRFQRRLHPAGVINVLIKRRGDACKSMWHLGLAYVAVPANKRLDRGLQLESGIFGIHLVKTIRTQHFISSALKCGKTFAYCSAVAINPNSKARPPHMPKLPTRPSPSYFRVRTRTCVCVTCATIAGAIFFDE